MSTDDVAGALMIDPRPARKHIKALRDRRLIGKEGDFYVRPDP